MSAFSSTVKLAGAVLALIGLGLIPLDAAAQDNCESTGGGDWSNPGNWTNCSGSFPESGDNARVQIGHKLTIKGSNVGTSLTLNNLTLEMGGSDLEDAVQVKLNGTNLDVDGNAVIGESVGGSDNDAGITQLNTDNSGSGGELVLAGDLSVLNDADLITSTSSSTGNVRLDGGTQTFTLNGTVIERLETDPGITLTMATDVTVTDLIADGSTGSSGLTIGDDGSGTMFIVQGTGTTVNGDLTVGSGATLSQQVSLTVGDLVNNGVIQANENDLTASTLTNNGNISLDDTQSGGTLKLTSTDIAGGDESINGASSTATLDISGGTMDVEHAFTNTSDGTLDLGDGIAKAGFDVTLEGTFNKNTPSEFIFDGSSVTLNGTDSALEFSNFTVKGGAMVDPNDSRRIKVTGSLTVEDNGQYGTSLDTDNNPTEGSNLRYEGSNFTVQTDGDLFANEVTFAGGGTMTVAGSVFATAVLQDNTEVEVGNASFDVFGLVNIKGGSELDVAANNTEVTLRDDLRQQGTLTTTDGSNTGTVNFKGGGRTTDCSLGGGSTLDCNTTNDVQEFEGGRTTFATLNIEADADGNPSKVKFSDSSDSLSVTGNFTVDNSDFDTGRPLAIQQDLTAQNGGTIEVLNESGIAFEGGSDGTVTTPSGLSVGSIAMNKQTASVTFNDDITIQDSLQMVRGTMVPQANVRIQDKLVLGDPDVNTTGEIDVAGGGGTVTLVSNDANQARVIYADSDDDGTIDARVHGNLTFQRRLDGGSGWYYLSTPGSPADSSDTFESFLEQGGSNDLRTRGPNGSDEPDFGGSSVRLYNENRFVAGDSSFAGWRSIDCTSFSSYRGCANGLADSMQVGRGYSVYVYTDDVGSPTSSGFPKIIDSDQEPRTSTSFKFANADGSPADGPGIDVTDDNSNSTVDSDEGWNLLGNPYFSQIDYCKIWDPNDDIGPNVYVWDPTNATDGTNQSAYASYNCDAEVGGGQDDPDSPDGSASTLTEGYISPLQGFFVQGTALTSPDYSLEIGDITNAQADTPDRIFRKDSFQKPPAVQLQFDLEDMGYVTAVGFVEGSSVGADKSDGYYRDGTAAKSAMSIASILPNGKHAAVNVMPRELKDKQTIPLKVDGCNFGTALEGDASITWPTVRNLPSEWRVTLKDTETGETVNLREASEHTFEYTGNCPTPKAKSSGRSPLLAAGPSISSVPTQPVAKDGGANTRFQLVMDPDGGQSTLPVEFAGINAETDGQTAILNWTTASEQNNAGFRVQRKAEDGSFTSLGEGAFVESQSDGGTSEQPLEYSYRIEDLDPGTHTFRLKQVDTDGSASFSDPVETTVGINGTQLTTYPNPAEQQATVEFGTETSADVSVALYNTLGQKVQTIYRGPLSGNELKQRQVNVRTLGSGLYFVRMTGDGVNATQRMTVVK